MPRSSLVRLSSFLVAGLLACVAHVARANPPGGGQWSLVASVSDEFNVGSFDLNKWDNINPYFLGNAPGIYVASNVDVSNGNLELWVRAGRVKGAPKRYHDYTTSYVASHASVLYGYFETRAKPMPLAIDCGFWLYAYTPTGTYEIDIFEIGAGPPGQGQTVHTNTWVYLGDPGQQTKSNTVGDAQSWVAPFALAADYHIYGFEWTPSVLNFYFDGQLIRSTPNTYFHSPMQVRFSTETFPNWFGLPAKTDLPGVFEIDYVRVWQQVN